MYLKTISLLFLFCIAKQAAAQEIKVLQDLGAWVGVQLEKEITKHWKWELGTQVRTCRNSTRLDSYLAQTGVGYHINKNFSLGGYLRYIHGNEKTAAPQNSWRYHLDFKVQIKPISKLKLAYRLRYQQKFVNAFGQTAYPLADSRSTIRHRVKVRYKVHKKHKLYTSAELFIPVHRLNKYPYLKKIRWTMGDKIKTKIGSFDCGIGYEKHLQPDDTFSLFFFKMIYCLPL